MAKKALLVLQDGSVFEGQSFGAEVEAYGEVVFNTSIVGYQEMLTDPSYAGQIILPTYPLIGNYGVNGTDHESNKIQARGFAVREQCEVPSHYLSKKTLHEYLAEGKTPGIWGIDTRAVTRKLRSSGVMTGMITSSKTPDEAVKALKKTPGYGNIDFVREVSTREPYQWNERPESNDPLHVVILDCGLKFYIPRVLTTKGCAVTVVPCTTPASEILALNPDGILLSPGPGNPELLDYIVAELKNLIGKKPIMGICLGNQLIARAFGGKTFKLKFGHHGGNHPVKELATGRVYITAQNHGYAVDPDSIKDELQISFINLNDGTVEGLEHKELPLFSIQYHSEASPGPLDNVYLFEKFISMMRKK